MNKIIREPLIHFLLVGALLFYIFSLAQGPEGDREIIIDQYDIAELSAKWKLKWNRNPTDNELNSLIEQYIKEEVYYREGMAMNLDHNDEIIRRRIAQKMEFLSEGLAEASEPDDKTLRDFYEENKDKYIELGTISFSHIYFSNDKRENAYNDAVTFLSDTASLADQKIGDVFPFEQSYKYADRSTLINSFGTGFADTLLTVRSTGWKGPFRSGFGYHAVNVISMNEPAEPEFNDIRSKLLVDYTYDLQVSLNDALYRELRSKYTVTIENEVVK